MHTRRTAASEPLIGPDGFQLLPPELMAEAAELMPAETRPTRTSRAARSGHRQHQEAADDAAAAEEELLAGPPEPEARVSGRTARATARRDRQQRRGRKRPRERAAAVPRRQPKRARRNSGSFAEDDFMVDEDDSFLAASDEDEPDSDADSEAVWSEGSELEDPAEEDDEEAEGEEPDPVSTTGTWQLLQLCLLHCIWFTGCHFPAVAFVVPKVLMRYFNFCPWQPSISQTAALQCGSSSLIDQRHDVQEAEARRAATAARRAENRQRRRAAAAAPEGLALSQGEGGGAPRRLGVARPRELTMYEWLQARRPAAKVHRIRAIGSSTPPETSLHLL